MPALDVCSSAPADGTVELVAGAVAAMVASAGVVLVGGAKVILVTGAREVFVAGAGVASDDRVGLSTNAGIALNRGPRRTLVTGVGVVLAAGARVPLVTDARAAWGAPMAEAMGTLALGGRLVVIVTVCTTGAEVCGATVEGLKGVLASGLGAYLEE
jgi:hypothetical protein